MSEPELTDVEHCLIFVRTWAEAVLRQVERVRATRRKFREEDDGRWTEDRTPENVELQRNWRSLWAEQHMLVWSAFQLEEWCERLARVRKQQPPERNKLLKALRNSLEHLDKAELGDGSAGVPPDAPPKEKWSLRKLPNGRLALGVGGRRVFELIEPKVLEERAVAILGKIDAELAVEWDALVDAAGSHYCEMQADAQAEAIALRRAGITFFE